jgi:hypothetical protein
VKVPSVRPATVEAGALKILEKNPYGSPMLTKYTKA